MTIDVNMQMIARLAETAEFAELQKLFEHKKQKHLSTVASKLYGDPHMERAQEISDTTLKMRGIEDFLQEPHRAKLKLTKETDD